MSRNSLGGGVWISNYANVVLSGVQILDNKPLVPVAVLPWELTVRYRSRREPWFMAIKPGFHGGGILWKLANVEMTGGEISDNQAQVEHLRLGRRTLS